MTPTLFGFLGDIEGRFERLAHNCLLVAGGFLVGYLLGGLGAWAANRYVLRRRGPEKKLPEPVSQICRIIGGILGALIVALLVFAGGMGGGSGAGGGQGETPADKAGQPKADPAAKVDPKVNVPKPPDPKPADVIVPVTILGGEDVREGRFYLIGDDRTPKTFDEFKDAILARKAKEPGKLGLELVFPPKNVLPLDHPAVTRVIRWAKEDARIKAGFAEDR